MRGLARDERGEHAVGRGAAVFAQHRGEAVAIVEADKPAEIFGAVEFDSLGAEHAGEGLEVERLGVGERAVEVENNCTDHREVIQDSRAKLLTSSPVSWGRNEVGVERESAG